MVRRYKPLHKHRLYLRALWLIALLSLGLLINLSRFPIAHATGGTGPNSIATPVLPTTPIINLSTCQGTITQSGNYVLNNDLIQPSNSGSACISLANLNGVSLDCQGYAIQPGTGSPAPLGVYSTSNFSIKNCNLPNSTLSLNGVSKGIVDNMTMSSPQGQGGTFRVSGSDNVSITNSTLTYSPYYQTNSSYINFSNNKISADPTIRSASLSGTVELDNGSNDNLTNNTVEGSWRSGLASGLASDDGIMLQGRSGDYIYNNTIHDAWDTGIETIGQTTNEQILNNTITNMQYYGIGGWYQNSWLNNIVQNNTVSETGKVLEFFVDTSQFSNYKPQTFYFQGNQFSGNQFVSGDTNSSGNEAAVINYNSAFLPAGVTPTIGNNTFQNNNFGVFSTGPHFDPASMVTDLGSNICAPNHSYPSLACTSAASAPSEPPPPPASPVDTITATTNPIFYGTNTSLSWGATNSPTSCSGNFPGLTGTSGTYSPTLSTTTTYYFNCSNATAGNTAWVTVDVITPDIGLSGSAAVPLNLSSTYTASIAGCTPAANGWTWNTGGGTGSSTTNSIGITWPTAGGKTITVSNSACGTKTGTLSVMVNSNNLGSNQQLSGGSVLQSSDGRYTLAMQSDGNLVVYDGHSGALWNTATTGSSGDHVAMQSDGNLVVYSSDGHALWNSGTAGNSSSSLTMQSDGNLVIYDSHGRALWSWRSGRIYLTPYTSTDMLNANQTLNAGNSLSATNWSYMVAMQSDGNLVVYDNYGRPLWSAGTGGHANDSGARVAMQSDGNLVIYNGSNQALWNSTTTGNSGARLVMQPDGNLVIYANSRALWSWRSGRLY